VLVAPRDDNMPPARVLGGNQARLDVQDIDSKYLAFHVHTRPDLVLQMEDACMQAELAPEQEVAPADSDVNPKIVVPVGEEDDATEDGLFIHNKEKLALLGPLALPRARACVEAHVEVWKRVADGALPCLIIEDGLRMWPRLAQITAHLVATVERVVTDAEESNVLLFLGGTCVAPS
jgi:hypothetical protein